jgi:uncharacterized delta-60 repeat protein
MVNGMNDLHKFSHSRLKPLARYALLVLLITLSWTSAAVAQEVDADFNPVVPFETGPFAVQDDGKILVGEFYETFAAFTDMRRFLPNGAIDPSFNHSANALDTLNNGRVARVYSVSCFMDGTIAVSGTFDRIDGFQVVPRIAKFNRAGALIYYPAPFTDAIGWVVAPQMASLPDNRAMIWGYFSRVNGIHPRRGAVLASPSGAWVSSFSPNLTSNSTGSSTEIDHRVVCMLRQPDGKFLISGWFDRVGGENYPYLVRVTASGMVDPTFQPNPNGYCFNIALQADGKILVTGQFSQIGGGFRSGIARLNSNGTLDESFLSWTNGGINSIVSRVDGKVLVSGNFTSVTDQVRGRVALLESDGSVSEDFGNSTFANASVWGLFVQEDGKALLAGAFGQVGQVVRSRLARLTPDVPAVSHVEVDAEGTELIWRRGGSVQEIENAEFRLSLDGRQFGTLLGNGRRVEGGWKLENLKLPGNRVFHIQVRGLARGGYLNSSTSLMRTVTQLLRPLPQVIEHPTEQTVVAGTTGVSFATEASSAARVVYQWRRNGRPIPGGTGSSYTIPGGVTSGHAGRYTCTITSSAGAVTTQAAQLTVISPISIVVQPQVQAVLAGRSAVFSVKVIGSNPAYRWFKDNEELLGVNGPVLKIPVVNAASHEGVYQVQVSNFGGTVASQEAALHVVEAAPTATAPVSQVLALGESSNAEIESDIVSESPAVVQWLRDGRPIKGASSARLNLSPVTLQSAGRYAVRASNPMGAITSDVGEIAVVDQHPGRLVVAEGGTVVLTATAAGNNLSYRWRKGVDNYLTEGGAVAGVLTARLTLSNLTAGDAGDYTCEVTAAGGTLDAGTQRLWVSSAVPQIVIPVVMPQGMLGAEYDFQVPMDSSAEAAVSLVTAKGLPPGLRVDGTGRVTGRPTRVGTFSVSLTPSNPTGVGATVTASMEVIGIPATLVGGFVGFIPGDPASSLLRQGARLDLTVSASGVYSGRLTLGASTVRVAGGKLNAGVGINGVNVLSLPRRGAVPLVLTFQINESDQTIAGTLSDGVVTGNLNGWRNGWSRAVKAESYRGYYTNALRGPAPVIGLYDWPNGDGSCTLTITELGQARLVGRLPDGTAFTTSCFVGQSGQVAIHAVLYRSSGGLVNGNMEVTPSGAAPGYLSSTVSGAVSWYKLPMFAGVSYAAGFEAVSLSVEGAKYALPAAGNVLGSVPNAVVADVEVDFEGAKVEEEVDQNPNVIGRMSAASQFVLPSAGVANPAATSLRLNARTGLFTGAFALTTKRINNPALATRRTAQVFGIVVRNAASQKGLGFGAFTLVQSPGQATAKIFSGRVRVRVP